MSLAQNVHRMCNSELNGLARNRYIDEETQLEIAKHPYLICRKHLAENPSITDSTVDILLSGRANSVKHNLVGSNRLNDRPDLIEKIYFDSGSRFKESWRVGMTFLRGGWYGGTPNTPVSVLKDIYKRIIQTEAKDAHSQWSASHWGRHLASHPNVDSELAVKMSLSTVEPTRKAAFDAIVRLRREELKAASA